MTGARLGPGIETKPEEALELARILRELSRRRALVAVVIAFSILIGFLLAFRPGMPPKSRQYEVALSSADILVDTRKSQVVAVGRKGPELPTLAGRANLMGNLMTSGELKEEIAKRAGVSAEKLIVVPPADPSTPWLTPVPVKPRGAAATPPRSSWSSRCRPTKPCRYCTSNLRRRTWVRRATYRVRPSPR